MNTNTKIYIAGHRGMVGRAIWKKLDSLGFSNLIGRSSTELDLRDQQAVNAFIQTEDIEVIIDAAARVGGILANSTYPYKFIMENLQIQNNLIDSAVKANIKHFIFLGSSCIYPKFAEQPISESSLLSDYLEPTNQWYAIAKIAGVKACEAVADQFGYQYVSLMPTNLYGPNDNYDLETSHVLPAMIRKFHDAKINGDSDVTLWGSGTPMREFLHVDDMADAVAFCLKNGVEAGLYNVGTGQDITIKDLALKIQKITGHKGKIIWDSDKPDGTPRKLLNIDKLAMQGWKYSIELNDGIETTYNWFKENITKVKEVKL